jgi:hypothetical protein
MLGRLEIALHRYRVTLGQSRQFVGYIAKTDDGDECRFGVTFLGLPDIASDGGIAPSGA